MKDRCIYCGKWFSEGEDICQFCGEPRDEDTKYEEVDPIERIYKKVEIIKNRKYPLVKQSIPNKPVHDAKEFKLYIISTMFFCLVWCIVTGDLLSVMYGAGICVIVIFLLKSKYKGEKNAS